MSEMSEEVKDFRRKCLKEYRDKNKEKQKQYRITYWNKRFEEEKEKK